jgi:hypothetical protein
MPELVIFAGVAFCDEFSDKIRQLKPFLLIVA